MWSHFCSLVKKFLFPKKPLPAHRYIKLDFTCPSCHGKVGYTVRVHPINAKWDNEMIELGCSNCDRRLLVWCSSYGDVSKVVVSREEMLKPSWN